jgi:SpoVK/Ycf46/Vps4 family AAA+-type ATPase
MRFIVQPGTDPVAHADASLLRAMGLPGGGVVALGETHCMVAPGNVPSPNALLVGPRTRSNAGVEYGMSVNVERALVPEAQRVVVDALEEIDHRDLSQSLQGNVVSEGDVAIVHRSYSDGKGDLVEVRIRSVDPGSAGLVVGRTLVNTEDDAKEAPVDQHDEAAPSPTSAEALVAGLSKELDTLTGWLTLLTSSEDLPRSWGLPDVAGVIVAGPSGGGKAELVAAAAAATGAGVRTINVDLVFKPERLLSMLEAAVKTIPAPGVIFIDRIDAVAGEQAMYRNQVAAILRWFLDAVAEKRGIAVVIGATDAADLAGDLAKSPLLPRTMIIPPPDSQRREQLFAAALSRVPTGDVDTASLAAQSAGFSAADVVASVLEASARAAGAGRPVTQEDLEAAVQTTTPSLGAASIGEIPTYGFERVADLDEIKQRLTESVIWQMQDPDRFTRLGVDPPKGLLLYGPPGTGKTFVMRALAHESGAAFFPVKGAELLDKWVGESERAVRELFARATAVAPSILFFDEIDALAPVRGHSTNTVTDSVVAALLTEIDGVGDRGDVFVIGATNRRDLVDPALLRPGRFEIQLHFGLPEPDARRAFFSITDMPFSDDVDIDRIVDATGGRSFADLSGILREAALIALRRDPSAITVTSADLTRAIEATSSGTA